MMNGVCLFVASVILVIGSNTISGAVYQSETQTPVALSLDFSSMQVYCQVGTNRYIPYTQILDMDACTNCTCSEVGWGCASSTSESASTIPRPRYVLVSGQFTPPAPRRDDHRASLRHLTPPTSTNQDTALTNEFSLVLTLHPNPRNVLEMHVDLWSNTTLHPGTRFYPDRGSVRLDKLEVYSFLDDKDIRNEYGSEDTITTIEDREVRHCNWVRFLKTSNVIDDVNIIGLKIKGETVFQTVRTILPNEEIVAFLKSSTTDREENEQEEVLTETEKAVKASGNNVKLEVNVTPVSPVAFPGSQDLLTSPPSREDDCKSSVSDSIHSADEISPRSATTNETERYSEVELSPTFGSFPNQISPLNLSSQRTPRKYIPTARASSTFTSPMSSSISNPRSPMTSPTSLPSPLTSHTDLTPSPPDLATRQKRNRERTWLPCEVCGKKFDRPSLLKRHMRTHTGEKPHACDVCGKAFSTSSSLNTHRRIHSGEKPHQCGVCGKRFTASSNLYYHRMTHNKEKPHKCSLCAKSFPTPGDLRSHMYVHNGSWPFRCDVCNRGFSKQTNLKNHLLLHTGDKPHECGTCHKKFALYCNLKTHLKTHEDDNQGSCISCGRTFLKRKDVPSDTCIDCIRSATTMTSPSNRKPLSDFSISKLTNSDEKSEDSSVSSVSKHRDPSVFPVCNPLMFRSPQHSTYFPHEHLSPIGFVPMFGGLASPEERSLQHARAMFPGYTSGLPSTEMAYQAQMASHMTSLRHDWSGLLAK